MLRHRTPPCCSAGRMLSTYPPLHNPKLPTDPSSCLHTRNAAHPRCQFASRTSFPGLTCLGVVENIIEELVKLRLLAERCHQWKFGGKIAASCRHVQGVNVRMWPQGWIQMGLPARAEPLLAPSKAQRRDVSHVSHKANTQRRHHKTSLCSCQNHKNLGITEPQNLGMP